MGEPFVHFRAIQFSCACPRLVSLSGCPSHRFRPRRHPSYEVERIEARMVDDDGEWWRVKWQVFLAWALPDFAQLCQLCISSLPPDTRCLPWAQRPPCVVSRVCWPPLARHKPRSLRPCWRPHVPHADGRLPSNGVPDDRLQGYEDRSWEPTPGIDAGILQVRPILIHRTGCMYDSSFRVRRARLAGVPAEDGRDAQMGQVGK